MHVFQKFLNLLHCPLQHIILNFTADLAQGAANLLLSLQFYRMSPKKPSPRIVPDVLAFLGAYTSPIIVPDVLAFLGAWDGYKTSQTDWNSWYLGVSENLGTTMEVWKGFENFEPMEMGAPQQFPLHFWRLPHVPPQAGRERPRFVAPKEVEIWTVSYFSTLPKSSSLKN